MNQQPLFFVSFIIYILLVYVLGNVVEISFLDEAFACLFLVVLFLRKIQKETLCIVLFFLFYFIYSYFWSENPNKHAQLVDLIQQIKPFLFFCFFYKFPLKFSTSQRQLVKFACIVSMIAFLYSYFDSGMYGKGLISHPFILGVNAFCFASLYYFVEGHKKSSVLIITLFLAIGALSLRAKFMGEFLLFMCLLLLVKQKIKLNLKYVALTAIVFCGGFYLVIDKFRFYFIASDTAARYLLYLTMPKVLVDHFPFGSGLASFATFASGVFYSPMYFKYGIAGGYGMSPDNFEYIADTWFPVLAQFGLVGVFLFCFFWYRRYNELVEVSRENMAYYRLGLLTIAMVMIESVAGPVFVMGQCFIPMALLGSICRLGADLQKKDLEQK